MLQTHRVGRFVVFAFTLDGGEQDLLFNAYVSLKRRDQIARDPVEPSKLFSFERRCDLLPQVAKPSVLGIHEAGDSVRACLNWVFLGSHPDSFLRLSITIAEHMCKRHRAATLVGLQSGVSRRSPFTTHCKPGTSRWLSDGRSEEAS